MINRQRVLVFLTVMALFFLSSQVMAADKLIVRFGHHHPPGGQLDRYATKFADLVKNKSNGAIEIKVLPGAQLGQEGEAAEGIHIGSLKMTCAGPPFLAKYVRELGADTLPFMWDSWNDAERLLNGVVGEEMNRRLSEGKANVQILSWLGMGFRSMLLIKKPESIKDLEGLKMRSPEFWLFIKMFEALGSRPTPITWGEVYTALQTGVVDGMETPYQAALDMKFTEVAKHWLVTDHVFTGMPHLVNEKWYLSLSKDTQKILSEAALEAAKWQWEKAEQEDIVARKELVKTGCTFTAVDRKSLREQMKPVYDYYFKMAPNGKSLIELIQKSK